MLDVAVVIVSWNVRDYLGPCLRSVFADFRLSGLHGEVWVVDNASTDGTVEFVRNVFPQVHVLANEENVGFGAANNQGMQAAAASSPRFYFLLNPDTLLRPGALTHLVSCLAERPHAGIAGARLVYGNGRFQHSAFRFPGLVQLVFDLFSLPARLYETRLNGRYPRRFYESHRTPFTVDFPLGATMMVRAAVAETTHGFDESFHMYCEEIDWSWRVRQAGWKIYAVPAAEVVHFGGESTRQIPAQSVINLWRSRAQLYHRHHNPLTRAMAARLVRLGMAKKAAQTSDPDLKRAYQEVVQIWANESG
ncbi:MAG: glycosyltransferase family 2 protein [Ardenticatenaceae bacterium]|nr:glycosyltransferase family 2 protein [Anaerolineales bacterium]MCB8922812.1 glycosyltransferase family 2 protein [Ardenticatenaceae bacterium]MCB8991945.1 glycosyltransferase family 2 protein [Ardenticatenaceae bacterium]MCB9004755.1 glycosyltransferase family 2 protein [Ardenticatenaceae bacterium]